MSLGVLERPGLVPTAYTVAAMVTAAGSVGDEEITVAFVRLSASLVDFPLSDQDSAIHWITKGNALPWGFLARKPPPVCTL